jgi:hypothetical protein
MHLNYHLHWFLQTNLFKEYYQVDHYIYDD